MPRVLVLRRLDGESFDILRSRGTFAPYDRILLAQDGDEVDGEGHSGESLLALRHSDRVTQVGNIHHVPTAEEIAAERGRHDGPLVVVNGGAGGDQLHDGYGHRLLAACHRTAAALHAAGHPARFVAVTGPYYAGPTLPQLPNLTVHRFTTALPALLAAADVAVIKPARPRRGGHAHRPRRRHLAPLRPQHHAKLAQRDPPVLRRRLDPAHDWPARARAVGPRHPDPPPAGPRTTTRDHRRPPSRRPPEGSR
ncbi:MAG: hypothetical protein ACRDRH_09065 [Pseudonocardia sp.]